MVAIRRDIPRVFIAASDSGYPWLDWADYICDGVDDQVEILAAFDAIPEGGCLVKCPGHFNIRK